MMLLSNSSALRSLEEFMRVMLSGSFREKGILPAEASPERVVVEGEEINLFYPGLLIVGEGYRVH